MHLARGDAAAIADAKCFRFAAAGESDFARDHHDASVPLMRMIGVNLTRSQSTIEDLLTLTFEIGFKLFLVHDSGSNRRRERILLVWVPSIPPKPTPGQHHATR